MEKAFASIFVEIQARHLPSFPVLNLAIFAIAKDQGLLVVRTIFTWTEVG